MKALFKERKDIVNFAAPLDWLKVLLDDDKVVLNVTDEEMVINATNSGAKTIVCQMRFRNDKIFSTFKRENTEEIGIYYLAEFAEVLSCFGDKTVIAFDGRYIDTVCKAEDIRFRYMSADTSLIKQGPDIVKIDEAKLSFWSEFVLKGDKLEKISKATSIMQQDLLVVQPHGGDIVSLSVADDMGMNRFSVRLPASVSDSSRSTTFEKRVFQTIFAPATEIKVRMAVEVGILSFQYNEACSVTVIAFAKKL